MKKLINSIAFLGLLLAPFAMFEAGCSTAKLPTPPPAVTQFIQSQLRPVTAAATAATLQKYPQYAPDFAAGANALDAIATGSNVLTAAQVKTLMAQNGETNPIVESVVASEVQSIPLTLPQGTNTVTILPAQYDQDLLLIAAGVNDGLPGPVVP